MSYNDEFNPQNNEWGDRQYTAKDNKSEASLPDSDLPSLSQSHLESPTTSVETAGVFTREDYSSTGNHFLTIQIQSTKKSGEAKNVFTIYEIHSETNLSNFRNKSPKVFRRYNDFLWLRNSLFEDYPASIVPQLPPKSSLSTEDRFSINFINKRTRMLQRFLFQLSQHPLFIKNDNLRIFLEMEHLPIHGVPKDNVVEILADKLHFVGSKPKVIDEKFLKMRGVLEVQKQNLKNLDDVQKTFSNVILSQVTTLNTLNYALEEFKERFEDICDETFEVFYYAIRESNENLMALINDLDDGIFADIRFFKHFIDIGLSEMAHRDDMQFNQEDIKKKIGKTQYNRELTESQRTSSQPSLKDFFSRTFRDLSKVDKEQIKQNKIQSLSSKIKLLGEEYEIAVRNSRYFDDCYTMEYEIFQNNKTTVLKECSKSSAQALYKYHSFEYEYWSKVLEDLQEKK